MAQFTAVAEGGRVGFSSIDHVINRVATGAKMSDDLTPEGLELYNLALWASTANEGHVQRLGELTLQLITESPQLFIVRECHCGAQGQGENCLC